MVVSLKRFVEAKRETSTEYERHGATLSGTSDYVQTRQRPRNVRFDYGPASDAELTPSQKFRVTSYIDWQEKRRVQPLMNKLYKENKRPFFRNGRLYAENRPVPFGLIDNFLSSEEGRAATK